MSRGPYGVALSRSANIARARADGMERQGAQRFIHEFDWTLAAARRGDDLEARWFRIQGDSYREAGHIEALAAIRAESEGI